MPWRKACKDGRWRHGGGVLERKPTRRGSPVRTPVPPFAFFCPEWRTPPPGSLPRPWGRPICPTAKRAGAQQSLFGGIPRCCGVEGKALKKHKSDCVSPFLKTFKCFPFLFSNRPNRCLGYSAFSELTLEAPGSQLTPFYSSGLTLAFHVLQWAQALIAPGFLLVCSLKMHP